MQETSTFPRHIKKGGVTVTIYRIKNRERIAYQTAGWMGGRRMLKNFANYSDALAHANDQATLIASGRMAVAAMKPDDRDGFVAAERILRETGTPLLDAVRAYAAAMRALNGTGSLLEAAKDYADRHSKRLRAMTVAEAVALFVENKRGTPGLDEAYVANVARDCGRIAAAFPVQIADLRAEDAQRWIRGLRDTRRGREGTPIGWKRQNDWRALIVEIAEYVRDIHEALPPGPVAVAKIQTLKKRGVAVGVLQPEELAKILAAAQQAEQAETVVYIAIGAFAGLRPLDETLSLDWKDVDLTRGHIGVSVNAAKTSYARRVPIAPNLAQWLAPYAKKSGAIFTENANERARYFAEHNVGIRIPNDGLRHSYGTARVAITRDLARVSHEMGNSPAVIKKHYDSVWIEDEGTAFFAITPDAPTNVVAMKGAA